MRTLYSMDLPDAQKLMEHLLTTATIDDHEPVAICIVDVTGTQLVAATMTGVKAPSIVTAHNKAVTAIRYQRDTVEFRYTRRESDGMWVLDEENGWDTADIMTASRLNPTFVVWAGGALVWDRARIVGAVGVSNRSELQDHDLASNRPIGWGM